MNDYTIVLQNVKAIDDEVMSIYGQVVALKGLKSIIFATWINFFFQYQRKSISLG